MIEYKYFSSLYGIYQILYNIYNSVLVCSTVVQVNYWRYKSETSIEYIEYSLSQYID